MAGILYVEEVSVEATSGQMLVTFTSGGEAFRFHLPPHTGLKFREIMVRNGWGVLCAPDAETVSIAARRARARREARSKREVR